MKKAFLVLIIIPLLFLAALPVAAAEKEGRQWQDETIYYLMIDRFNNGDNNNDFDVDTRDPLAYHGGDFEGIILQLDYLKDMGFTTIMLSPVFDNTEEGFHGYFINDFYQIDEHFGSMETFKTLVKETHDRGMNIVLDFVVNHVSPDHPWLNDPTKEDWFHPEQEIVNWNDQDELENNWHKGLPDLNQDNPEVRKYLLEAAKWWIEEADIDGYRLNHVQHVPADFWNEFSEEVKSVKEDFYLLGDVNSTDASYLANYLGTGIDSLADYSLNEPLRSAFSEPDQSLEPLFAILSDNESSYKEPTLMGQFMDNQDTIRFTEEPVAKNEHPGPRWRLALTYLYTTPGIPIVFYGSEIALAGGEAPDNLQQMNFMTDKELVEYITQLGDIRGKFPSLTRGTLDLLYEEEGMAIYKRQYEDETTVVAINNTSKTQSVTLTADQLENEKELRGTLSGDLIRSDNGEYKIVLDREEAEVYLLAQKSGINIPYLIAIIAVVVIFILFIFALKKRAKRGTPSDE
jgi:hypothetical protein